MKRTERHHLKENELANLAASAQEAIRARQAQILWAVAAVAVVGIAVLGYMGWRSRAENRAGTLLAEALMTDEARVGPPPAPGTPATGLSFPTEKEKYQAALAKFKQIADQFPSTDAGFFARYREATTHMALGNPKEAAAVYQQVVDANGAGIYGQMARLGLAEAQVRSGSYEDAIKTYQELSQQKDGSLPVDGILMQLGRAYVEAGKPADAQQAFTRIVEEFPQSPFSGEAKRELDTLKKTT